MLLLVKTFMVFEIWEVEREMRRRRWWRRDDKNHCGSFVIVAFGIFGNFRQF